MCLLIGGCSSKPASAKTSIYNDSAKIAEEGDSYTFTDKQGNVDSDGGDMSYKGFSGMITLWSVDNPSTEEGTLTISWKLITAKGQGKLVYLSPDGTTQVLAEGDSDGELQLKIPAGTGRIKLVGQTAKGSLSADLSSSEGLAVSGEQDSDWAND